MDHLNNCGTNPCEECMARFNNVIASPKFAYARYQSYGTQIYHTDDSSPTGVLRVAGIPHKIADDLLKKYNRASSLSPTEGLQTARNITI